MEILYYRDDAHIRVVIMINDDIVWAATVRTSNPTERPAVNDFSGTKVDRSEAVSIVGEEWLQAAEAHVRQQVRTP